MNTEYTILPSTEVSSSHFCEERKDVCVLGSGWYVDWLLVWVWRGPSSGFDVLAGERIRINEACK